jgi:hypothetical protein
LYFFLQMVECMLDSLFFNKLWFSIFWKLGIRPKDRLIRGDQSHRPLVWGPV